MGFGFFKHDDLNSSRFKLVHQTVELFLCPFDDLLRGRLCNVALVMVVGGRFPFLRKECGRTMKTDDVD